MDLKSFLRKHYAELILGFFSLLFFVVNIRMNIFSYNNFDFGKFDLGNMAQMLWNTLHGRFMYLTDYFGTNLPRWGMSHVDPILLLFLPLFAIFPHPLTLVFAQILLLLASAFVLFYISMLRIKSKFVSLMVALSYLAYPALGFLTAKTGFHGVSAAVFFFLMAFYQLEKMRIANGPTKKTIILYWIYALVAMSGKEQISLYMALLGIYVYFMGSSYRKLGLSSFIVGIIWFVMCFFIIIPHYASYRVAGYEKFTKSLDITQVNARNVGLDNYFLSRYDEFGDSYGEIALNIFLNPKVAIKVFFGGDKLENFNMTFSPVGYLPFVAPQLLIMAVPDLMMNYLTTAGGIGTSEIQNHRISMIIPVLFLAVINALYFIMSLIGQKSSLFKYRLLLVYFVAFATFLITAYTSARFQNPVYMWLKDALIKRLPTFIAQAKTDLTLSSNNQLKIGDVVKISPLENKDRECAQQIVSIIPSDVSVSGPDYLGAHLGMRETYAIFPALYNEADYVIVDVFSKKILTILDIDTGLVSEIVNKIIKSKDYTLQMGCGNLFVYKKQIDPHKTGLLPIQEYYRFPAKFDYPIYGGLALVDYMLPKEFVRGVGQEISFVLQKRDNLGSFFLFTNFVNTDTGAIYQSANLPSFAIKPTVDWKEDYFYSESNEVVIPNYIETGTYKVFLGMTNYVKTRSVYLGEVEIK